MSQGLGEWLQSGYTHDDCAESQLGRISRDELFIPVASAELAKLCLNGGVEVFLRFALHIHKMIIASCTIDKNKLNTVSR